MSTGYTDTITGLKKLKQQQQKTQPKNINKTKPKTKQKQQQQNRKKNKQTNSSIICSRRNNHIKLFGCVFITTG